MNIDDKNLVVRQSNELIEASYKIASVGEGRLMRMLIAQIKPDDEDFKTYRISVADFARFFCLSPNSNSIYEQIENSARGLREREVAIKKGKGWFYTGWLSSAEYVEGSGFIEVSFHSKLKPYLLQLKGYFTQYNLERVVSFKSGYSMRLFELLKMEQFKANGEGYFRRSFEYDELREKLGISKDEYTFFKDFRVRAVETAIREINENPDIHILQVDYPKTGRKVSHIVFHCEKAKQTQLDLDGPPPKLEEVGKEDHPEDVRELVALGIEEATAYKWRRKYGVRQVVRNIAYTQAMKRAGKIRDSVTGFLARAIADNLGGGWEAEQKEKEKKRKESEAKEAQTQAQEDGQRKAEREKRQALLTDFHALPENEQESVRKLYEAQANTTALMTWNKVKKANPERPEDNDRTRVDFLMFYKTYKANLKLDI